MKIQWKIMYLRCTDCMNLFKNSNSLNLQNCENSMDVQIMYIRCTDHENSKENCVHQMYRLSEFVEKFKFVECIKS